MKHEDEICDSEIRIIGQDPTAGHIKHSWKKWVLLAVALVLAVVGGVLWMQRDAKPAVEAEPGVYEPIPEEQPIPEEPVRLGMVCDSTTRGFIERRDTVINDILLRLFIPHQADMSLHVGRIDPKDTTIVYVAQAADVRRDNGGIVGAFVLKGKPLAWGLSKKGYCAVIDNEVKIGMADNSPLFEEATEREGYFFRQYSLVDNGRLIENEPKNKSIRRALCDRNGEIFMVDCTTTESFHDFAQALVDLGVTHAIYLVGSNAFGWSVDAAGKRETFGDPNNRRRFPPKTSYIVWRKR